MLQSKKLGKTGLMERARAFHIKLRVEKFFKKGGSKEAVQVKCRFGLKIRFVYDILNSLFRKHARRKSHGTGP